MQPAENQRQKENLDRSQVACDRPRCRCFVIYPPLYLSFLDLWLDIYHLGKFQSLLVLGFFLSFPHPLPPSFFPHSLICFWYSYLHLCCYCSTFFWTFFFTFLFSLAFQPLEVPFDIFDCTEGNLTALAESLRIN